MQISIVRMLVIVGALGLASFAAVSGSLFWVAIVSLVTFICLFSSVIGAVMLTGHLRAFWLGFAVFGWGLILLGILDEARVFYQPIPLRGVELFIYDVISHDKPTTVPVTLGLPGSSATGKYPLQSVFVDVVGLLKLLVFAMAGGFIGRWIFMSHQRSSTAG